MRDWNASPRCTTGMAVDRPGAPLPLRPRAQHDWVARKVGWVVDCLGSGDKEEVGLWA
jgi:hypothetical protein